MIHISVFNVGRGASVLIEMPRRESGEIPVGIYDCYSGTGGRHPLLKALIELDESCGGALSIEFLVLSHMHLDHFLGVAAVLKRFENRIKLFADPGLDPRAVVVAEFPTDAVMDTRAREEIRTVENFKARHPSRVRAIASPGLMLYEDAALGLRIRSIAPCGTMLREMTDYLGRYLRRAAQVVQSRTSDELHLRRPNSRQYNLNRSSSALEVLLGRRRTVLGGDVLSGVWSVLLDGEELRGDAILLSHHGSGSGFPKRAWPKWHEAHVINSGFGYAQPSTSVVEKCLDSGARFWGTNVPQRWRRLGSETGDDIYEYVRSVHYNNIRNPAEESGDVRVSISAEGIVASGPEFVRRQETEL